MKLTKETKNKRHNFWHKGRKCPRCQGDISSGGHFVPGENAWICNNKMEYV